MHHALQVKLLLLIPWEYSSSDNHNGSPNNVHLLSSDRDCTFSLVEGSCELDLKEVCPPELQLSEEGKGQQQERHSTNDELHAPSTISNICKDQAGLKRSFTRMNQPLQEIFCLYNTSLNHIHSVSSTDHTTKPHIHFTQRQKVITVWSVREHAS